MITQAPDEIFRHGSLKQCCSFCDLTQNSLSMSFLQRDGGHNFTFSTSPKKPTTGSFQQSVNIFKSSPCMYGEGNGNPFQYSCLENPMDGGAWQAAVHGVAGSRARLSDFTFNFSLSCMGEGNGNPLQCSCLENPRDRGDWWAAVYGIAQSRTRLKQLSSHVCIHTHTFLSSIAIQRHHSPSGTSLQLLSPLLSLYSQLAYTSNPHSLSLLLI